MNSKTRILLVLLCLGLSASNAVAKDYAVALTSHVSAAQAKVYYSSVMGF
jgi:hypothetical protein